METVLIIAGIVLGCLSLVLGLMVYTLYTIVKDNEKEMNQDADNHNLHL